MTGKLTFASTAQERDDISRETGALAVSGPSETRRMLDHLRGGGSAVAVMNHMMTGFRVPDGVEIDFTESCPKTGPERLQAEGRRNPGTPALYPYQQRVVDRLRRAGRLGNAPEVAILDPADMDGRIERALAEKSKVTVVAEAHHIKDPFGSEGSPQIDVNEDDPEP